MADCYDDYGKRLVQEKLDMEMPWIGPAYIAAASAVCTLAMAADVINGFRLKKLWFPCKFFSVNAASLAVLTVATKLPVDFNTNMLNPTDMFAKYTSLIFLITALANFMTSLGSMTDGEMLANVVALAIFVITVAGNVCIQLIEGHQFIEYYIVVSIMFALIFMILLLTTIVSLAIACPNIKRSLELKYQEKHRATLREAEVLNRREGLRIDDMMKYLVMAESSSPQFVMARSVVCSSSASTFLFASIIHAAIIFVADYIIQGDPQKNPPGESPYKHYTAWILYVQLLGVLVGAIAPASRLLVAVSFKCSTSNRFKMEFKIEDYWNGNLMKWRDSFSGLLIQQNLCRKYLHDAKWFALTFFIAIQILVVLLSKLLLLLFSLFMIPLLMYIKELKDSGHDSEDDDTDGELSSYVLRLEGEVELPRSVLRNICLQADQLIQKGRKMQPPSLFKLLQQSTNFSGVGQFDSNQFASQHFKEPPNCWTLPVVTLTSIAIALPNIDEQKVKQLLSSVSEGLSLAKIVEKILVNDDELLNITKAMDICWAGVVLYKKWLKIDLKEASRRNNLSKEVLEVLATKAEEIITKFKEEERDAIVNDPLNWPTKTVAANSMHRITRTILFSCEVEEHNTDEELFERLSVMIADILAACLTNLPHAITTMCHISTAIERREESVREAFILVGKTEHIFELLQEHEWPPLDHVRAASIDEWRALFHQNNGSPASYPSTSSVGTRSAPTSQEHFRLTVLH